MRTNKKLLGVLAAVTLVVAGGAVAFLTLGGSDGPAPLSLDESTSTTADGGAAPTTAAGSPDGAWKLTDKSQAGYRVLEDRLGGVQNIEAVGRTNQVTGGFTVAGTKVTDILATVDVASITSDSSFRDGRFAGSIMDAAQFPTATFEAAEVDLGTVPELGATVKVPATGTLTLKGQSRPVTTTLEVRWTADEVQVLGSIPVVFADFGIETPQPPGLKVRDEGTVEVLLVAVPAR
jgi:polyisoprenoid-binding protein YceI